MVTVVAIAMTSCQPGDKGAADRGIAEKLSAAGLARPNILLVTLDTTRADHLSPYGYSHSVAPHLERIAREGVLFRSCTAPSAFTLPSHSSIFTGTYPAFHGVRINGTAALSEGHETLAEILAANGYRTGAFIGAFVLDGRWGLNQGFDRYDDLLDLTKFGKIDLAGVQRPANEVVDAALGWLGEPSESPFFAWIHLYDPHAPYEPPEPWYSRFESRGMVGLYDGELAFADSEIGRVLTWLEEEGLANETILAVMGDHGEALGSHGELTHGYFVYDYAVQVPFLLRTPLAETRQLEVEELVRTIDLYPTLLEMLNLEIPEAVQGRSLVSLLEGSTWETASYAYSESMVPYLQYGWSPMYSIRTERYKYIDAPTPELYDLVADPGEETNLASQRARTTAELRKVLQRIYEESRVGAPEPEEADLDRETLDRLAALGYLGGAAPPEKETGLALRDLPDPKEKLEVYGKVSLAGDLINREEYPEALSHLEEVLELDPGVPQAKLLLATCYEETGRREEAKQQLDEVLRADPNDVQALLSMANLLSKDGRGEEVIAIGKKALTVDPRNAQAHILIGQVYMDRNDHQRALPHLQEAVEIQPKLTRNRMNLAACLLGLGRLGDSESILLDILAQHPKYPLAHFHLGLLYDAQGRPQEARAAYAKEVEYYDESVPARFNLGSLLLAMGDAEGYRTQMERVIEIAPDRPKGYLFLARGLLAEGGELARALELVETGLTLADDDELKALGHFLLADIYSREGERDKMAEALARARSFTVR
jgi:arylsulfatase A-like enzyme/Tfp pilus assembly protein PilF